jgi:hypothetical protein
MSSVLFSSQLLRICYYELQIAALTSNCNIAEYVLSPLALRRLQAQEPTAVVVTGSDQGYVVLLLLASLLALQLFGRFEPAGPAPSQASPATSKQ